MSYTFNFIGEINTANIITLNNYINSIPNLTQDDTLTININSTGGTVADGIAIYNIIKHLPCRTITNNLGEVSSAAILLYMSGNVRTACDISKFMIHPLKLGMNGSFDYYQIKEMFNSLEADISNYFSILTTELPAITQAYDILHFLQYDSLILNKAEAITCGIVTTP